MNRNVLVLAASFLTLTIAATFVSPAIAQQKEKTGQAMTSIEEITVEAPRVVRREVGRTAVGGKLELITLTRRVNYADLDLTVDAQVTQLEKRVNDVARDACDELARVYPAPSAATRECVREAMEGAKPQVDAAVDAAKG
jgi:UrcA family protein